MIKKPLSQFVVPVLALPRTAKRIVTMLVDIGLCVLTVWLAYYLRLGKFVALSGHALWAVVASLGIAVPIFIVSGLYRAVFRYSGWPALMTVARAVTIYGLLYASIFTAIGIPDVPRTIGIIQPILLFLFVGASRAMAQIWLGDQYQLILKHAARPKVLIYGAGNTGRQLATVLRNCREMQMVGFLDDDDRLHGHMLDGKPIYSPEDLSSLVSALCIREVLLAIPSIERKRRNEILERIRKSHAAVRTLPPATDLTQERVSLSDLCELDINDLLGREAVPSNHILLSKNIAGKVVTVTGAGGFIGSELCRQILWLGPEKLLLIEQNEGALWAIHRELEEKQSGPDTKLVPLFASVQDEERMHAILTTWKPDTIYHAAAYKHVPLIEHNPAEGIKNNVLGTLKVAKAAADNDVADFILVSIEQAQRPTNIMEASKRLAEIVLQALAAHHSVEGDTRFTSVRFGNVPGPCDAVIPIFRQQIRNGGPVVLRRPEIAHYFMTAAEAAQLTIQAGAMAKSGEVFVLDMGAPADIVDLARRMIELSGLTVKDTDNPDGDIEIEIAKRHSEEKFYGEPIVGKPFKPSVHSRIMKTQEDFIPWKDLESKLAALETALNIDDVGVIRLMLQQLVTNYVPSGEIMDWIYRAQEAEVLGLTN